MRDPVRHFVAEFLGVFALVFVGSAAVMLAKDPGAGGSLAEVALAHGLILAVMVSALMRVSGHFNPAVTLAFLVTRRVEPMMGALYVVAQIIGGIAGAYALKAVFPDALVVATNVGGQSVADLVTSGQAFIGELIATFFLMFAVMGTVVDQRGPRLGGLFVGLAYAAGIFAIGPVTGGSMNPARSFGPAVVSQHFVGQVIYWTAPIVGALLAAVVYEFLFLRGDVEPASHGELAPSAPVPPRQRNAKR